MLHSFAAPMSTTQKKTLFPGGQNKIFVFSPRTDLQIAEIQNVLKQVVKHHDCLRVTVSDDGDYYYVNHQVPFDFFISLESIDQDHLMRAFNLKEGPGFRFQFIKKITGKSQLLLAAHELVWNDPTFDQVTKSIGELLSPDGEKEKLKNIWKGVMDCEAIGDDDNFFKLGGHSLLAVELAEKIREAFQKEIFVRDIFENPTINGLMEKMNLLKTTDDAAKLSCLGARLNEGPLSFNQMQVWYTEELFPETRMHNLSTSLRMKWKVRPHLLKEAIHVFFRRHATLRTIIVNEPSGPVQRVLPEDHPAFKPELEVVTVKEDRVLSLMKHETLVPLDKRVAPLFRAKLYMLGPSDFVFFFMAHHAVWDGWCFDIFFEELNIIYSSLENGVAPVFEKNPDVSYLEFSNWQHESVKNGKFHPQIQYWKSKLSAPLPILELPLDFKRPKTPTHNGGHLRFALSPKEQRELKLYASKHEVTLYHVLLTAFKITLARQTGMEDIIVGSPIRGRNQNGLQQTMGYFVNTLPLRTRIRPDLGLDENLRAVFQTCLEAFTHQDVPFEVILRGIEYPRDMGRTAVFQTYFTFQDMTNRQFSINGKEAKQMSVNNASVKTDLDMWAKVTTSSIEGAIEYRNDLFKEVTMKKFLADFHSVLAGISESHPPKSAVHKMLSWLRR